ncbi:hypothetical protein D3C79_912900 [compost metagenome]
MAAVPGALVQRLFLAPDEIMHVSILLQHGLNGLVRERIQLLDTYDGHVFLVVLAALFQQIVIDLTGAHHHAFDLFRIQLVNLADSRQEGAVSQFFQRRNRQRVTQQGFR